MSISLSIILWILFAKNAKEYVRTKKKSEEGHQSKSALSKTDKQTNESVDMSVAGGPLFVSVIEISDYCSCLVNNKSADVGTVVSLDGETSFVLKVSEIFENNIEAFFGAQNRHVTSILGDISQIDTAPKAVFAMDVPNLIETDGGFAGVLCDYIVLISRRPIDIGKWCILHGIRLNEKIPERDLQDILSRFK